MKKTQPGSAVAPMVFVHKKQQENLEDGQEGIT